MPYAVMPMMICQRRRAACAFRYGVSFQRRSALRLRRIDACIDAVADILFPRFFAICLISRLPPDFTG